MHENPLQNEQNFPDEPRSVEDIFQSITEDGKVTGVDLEDFEELENKYKILKGNLIDEASQALIGSLEDMLFDGFTVFNENDYKVLESICRVSGINSGVLPLYDRMNFNQNQLDGKQANFFNQYLGKIDLPFSVTTGGDGFLNVFGSGGKHIFDIKEENIILYSEDMTLPFINRDDIHNNNNAEYISDVFEDENLGHIFFPDYEDLEEQEILDAQSYNNRLSEQDTEALLIMLGAKNLKFTEETINYITDYQSYAGIPIDGKIGPMTLSRIVEDYIINNGEILRIENFDYKVSCENGKILCEKIKTSTKERIITAFKNAGDYDFGLRSSEISMELSRGDVESFGKFGYKRVDEFSGDVEQQYYWKKIDNGGDGEKNYYSILYTDSIDDEGISYGEIKFSLGKDFGDDYIRTTLSQMKKGNGFKSSGVTVGAGGNFNNWARVDANLGYNLTNGVVEDYENKITGSIKGQLQLPNGNNTISIGYRVTTEKDYAILSFTGKRNHGGYYEIGLADDGEPYVLLGGTKRMHIDAFLPKILRTGKSYLNYELELSGDGSIDLKVKVGSKESSSKKIGGPDLLKHY